MKKIFIIFGLMLILFSSTQAAFAKKLAPKSGFVETYKSSNGIWRVEITYKGYPDNSPSECAFFEGDHLQWRREIPLTPGRVLISDSGRSIVMTRWGWYDEGGAKGLVFYNQEGDLLKEVSFSDDPSKGSLLWMDAFIISSDGKYCVVASHWRDKGQTILRLYNCLTGDLVWLKNYAMEHEIIEPVAVKIADYGRMILLAAYNYSTADMAYFILDIDGNILWQESLFKNFSWDRNDYIRMDDRGYNFEIFDKSKNSWRRFHLENRRVEEKTR